MHPRPSRRAVITACLLSFALLHRHLLLQRQRTIQARWRRRTRRTALIFLLFTFMTTQRLQYYRRFWMDMRSNHWINNVLGGSLLQDKEFSRTFRMNPRSFMKLHKILGIFVLQTG